jgi:hypothetical protein
MYVRSCQWHGPPLELPTKMARKQLMRTAFSDICWSVQEKGEAEFRPLRMNWVVITRKRKPSAPIAGH